MTNDTDPRWAIDEAARMLDGINPEAVTVNANTLAAIIEVLNTVQIVDDYPAHIGYCQEDIDLQLTADEWLEVCRQFNNADHSTLHEMLTDIANDVMSRRGQ